MYFRLLFIFSYASTCCSNVYALDKNIRVIGTNIEGITDYSGDWPFVNRMKSARKWITFDATGRDKTWDTKIPIPSDENGYPLRIPFDPDGVGGIAPQSVRTILINNNVHYPAGVYSLIFKGKGKIHLRVDSKCPDLRDGQCVFEKPNIVHHFLIKKPTKGGLRLKIVSSEADDHIRDIRVLPPGIDPKEQKQFHPVFLERLQGFKILRFMNWDSINHSEIKHWSDRVHTDHYTYAQKGSGVPYEVMLDLSNRVKADPWFVVPTMADDDFVKKLANLITTKLDKNRVVYLEYSNEVWNGIFPQARYATELGINLSLQLGLSLKKQEANTLFYTHRSVEIFEIFQRILKGHHKLVKVVSGQGMNPWVTRRIIRWLDDPRINPKKIKPDALAIAMYFGGNAVDSLLTNNGERTKKAVSVKDVKSIKVDRFLDEATEELYQRRIPRMIEQKKLASRYGMSLLAYEGGQAMSVGSGYSRPVIQAATEKIIKANRSERMGDLYNEMFNLWFGNGGNAFVNFSLIYSPRRWGAWGILEHQWQNPDQAPKYRAVKEELRRAK